MRKFQISNSKIKKFLPGIRKNISLKNYTSFRIGGPAKYFFEAKNKEDIIKAILAAKKFKLPFFILGNGSNLLVSDKGFDGVAIKMKNEKLKIKNYNSKFKIFAEAGTSLSKLALESVKIGAAGLEWMAGIPGTLGGAIRGNAGAFDGEMKDVVEEVEIYNTEKEELGIFKNKNCHFEYRSSIFRKNKNLIILSVELQLKKGNKNKIKEKMKEYLNYRKKNQPLDLPSVGSVFKNPKGFSAGELIEKCDFKGKRIGEAKVSEKHANFIVNLGNAKAKDVKKLIALIKQKVKNKFGIILEEEIGYLGLEN